MKNTNKSLEWKSLLSVEQEQWKKDANLNISFYNFIITRLHRKVLKAFREGRLVIHIHIANTFFQNAQTPPISRASGPHGSFNLAMSDWGWFSRTRGTSLMFYPWKELKLSCEKEVSSGSERWDSSPAMVTGSMLLWNLILTGSHCTLMQVKWNSSKQKWTVFPIVGLQNLITRSFTSLLLSPVD